jgi:CRP/FNR family transcriptional regulator, nitrogen oxide reductase regulator
MTGRRKSPLEIDVTETHMCSVNMRLQILAQVPFFAGLSQTDLEQVNHLFREHGFAPDESIYIAGDPATQFLVVADGRVKLMRHSLSGKDVILDILTPGEFFGSLSVVGDVVYPDTAEAQTQTCVLSIRVDDFRRILEKHPSVALKALDITAARLHAANERFQQVSALSVEERIANLLLVLSNKLGEPSDVGLLIQTPLARDDVASMTGTTSETVSRVMSQFQKDGLIRTGRQWVAIINRELLEQIAGVEVE